MKHITLSSTQLQSPPAGRPSSIFSRPEPTKHPTTSFRAMWVGGPPRRWSPSKTTYTPMGYSQGGFVGSYVCAGCWEPCGVLYLVREQQKWLCRPCKWKVRPLIGGREPLPVRKLGGDSEQEGR
jgi:hypothetical protein